jgi:hypothetical protein
LTRAEGGGEPAIEAAVIDTDDRVGPLLAGEVEEFLKDLSESPDVSQDVREADDRELGEIEGKLNASGRHGGAAGANEAGRRLAAPGQFAAERLGQFAGQHVAARLPRDEHERIGFHAAAGVCHSVSGRRSGKWTGDGRFSRNPAEHGPRSGA